MVLGVIVMCVPLHQLIASSGPDLSFDLASTAHKPSMKVMEISKLKNNYGKWMLYS